MVHKVRLENWHEGIALDRTIEVERDDLHVGDVIALELVGEEDLVMIAVTSRLLFVEEVEGSVSVFRESDEPIYKARLLVQNEPTS